MGGKNNGWRIDMTKTSEMPVVHREGDAATYAGQTVYVEGVYEQEDVRMMQVNPPTLLLGHVAVVLDDGCRVFLYPPAQQEARRSKQEIRRFEHKRVRVLGVIYPTIPQEGAVQLAPCLVDIQSIEFADSP